jgi:hypothetical protein
MDVAPGLNKMVDSIVVDDPNGIYAAVASVLMGMGRQAGSGPEAAGVKSRPEALVRRFDLRDKAQELLPGRRYGPTLGGLERIYSAMAVYTEPRAAIVKYFLAIGSVQGHLPVPTEIVMTNFRLMRGAGMTHVGAIIKLMNMHPWTVRVPELAPYYSKFASDLEEFAKIPLHVREYHRLLAPQGQYLFLSSELAPLVAVAGHYVKEVETSFSGYVYRAQEHASLIARVGMYEPTTSSYVGSSLLAQRLNIQDMTLPGVRAAKTQTISSVQ